MGNGKISNMIDEAGQREFLHYNGLQTQINRQVNQADEAYLKMLVVIADTVQGTTVP